MRMGRTTRSSQTRTYLIDETIEPQVHAVAEALSRQGSLALGKAPAVVSADGSRVDLPPMLHEAMVQVVDSLALGRGVQVAPLNSMLTTEEAAEFLGVSARVLHAMLERAEFGSRRPNRHRYIRLGDLLDFQERSRCARSEALARMARDAHEHGLYAALPGEDTRDSSSRGGVG